MGAVVAVSNAEALSPASKAYKEVMGIFEKGVYDNWEKFKKKKNEIIKELTKKDLEELMQLFFKELLCHPKQAYLTEEIAERFIKPRKKARKKFVFPKNENFHSALSKLEVLRNKRLDLWTAIHEVEMDEKELRKIVRLKLKAKAILKLAFLHTWESLAVSLLALNMALNDNDYEKVYKMALAITNGQTFVPCPSPSPSDSLQEPESCQKHYFYDLPPEKQEILKAWQCGVAARLKDEEDYVSWSDDA